MHSRFNLFQSHLDLAHQLWFKLLKSEDYVVVDATCGNGQDTLLLAKLFITADSGWLYACDIQAAAIEKTKKRLADELDSKIVERITLEQRSHVTFPNELKQKRPKLFVYNLGYLPGSDKTQTTRCDTTRESLLQACELVDEGGLISVTCYPGHPEGAREEAMLTEWCQQLSPKEWSCSWTRWINRKASPSLLLIQKAKHRF